jgi:steroid delta-isomerase-like uncharacterized protein
MEANKDLVRRMIDTVWNGRELGALDQFFAPDFFNHHPALGLTPDRAGLQQSMRMLQAGFPDLQVVIDDLIAEGDQVVARMTMNATHQGDLLGIPPTGKRIIMTAISILRIQGGRIVERWGMDTSYAVFQSLSHP